MTPVRAFLGGLLLAGCAALPPDVEPLPASRPGVADNPSIVTPGGVQLEAGAHVERPAGERAVVASELLARAGVLPGAEIRVGVETSAAPGEAGRRTPSFDDLELSTKLRITDGEAGLPAMALLAWMTLPTGAAHLTAKRAQPGAALLVDAPLAARFALGANLGAESVRAGDASFTRGIVAGIVGYELSERVQAELEYVHGYARSAELRSHHLGAGVAVLLSADLQLDGWGAWARAGGDDALLLGFGLSWRPPTP